MTFSEKLRKISYSRLRFLLLILSGFLSGLTLVFPEIGFIEWITIVPAGAILLLRADDKNIKLRTLYGEGFVFFYAYYIICYHWFLSLYPLDFVDGMTKLGAISVVALAWLGLSLLQALMGGLVFVLAGIVFRSRVFKKIKFCIVKPLAVAGIWAVFEWLQTFGWWGVPWGRLPIGQTQYLIGVQNAAWLGSYFVTFMIVSVNCLLALALLNVKNIKIGVFGALVLLIFQYASGMLIWFTNDTQSGTPIKVACVQGNVSSKEKWNEGSAEKTVDNYLKYTEQAALEGAELVIWPETAFPYDITTGAYEIYGEQFALLADKYDIYLLVGAFSSTDECDSLNSLICYTPDGEMAENIYSKRHLVPFGEYVPLRPLIETLFPPLAELVLSSGDVSEGEGTNIIEIKDEIGLGGLICFDSIYDMLTLQSVRDGAEIICLSTNDSWFSDSRALNIHNAHAQLRAIESGRYVARAANTGITSAITSRGEIVDSLPPLVEGKIVFNAYASEVITPWQVIGNSFVYILAIVYSLIVLVEIFLKIKGRIK